MINTLRRIAFRLPESLPHGYCIREAGKYKQPGSSGLWLGGVEGRDDIHIVGMDYGSCVSVQIGFDGPYCDNSLRHVYIYVRRSDSSVLFKFSPDGANCSMQLGEQSHNWEKCRAVLAECCYDVMNFASTQSWRVDRGEYHLSLIMLKLVCAIALCSTGEDFMAFISSSHQINQIKAAANGYHPRLGAGSPFQRLPVLLFEDICSMVDSYSSFFLCETYEDLHRVFGELYASPPNPHNTF
jgi:hypothetical protein